MIPLGNASHRPLHFPAVTLAIIATNLIAFFSGTHRRRFFYQPMVAGPGTYCCRAGLVTILKSMFMHAGWMHILGNMLFFWVFGPEIEDVMGTLP